MRSEEDFGSNAITKNGIRLETQEPNFIVLPIPENRDGSNTFVEIIVYLINDTSTPFYLSPDESLIPEILDLDGQAMQGQEALDEPADRVQRKIPAQSSFRFKLTQFLSTLARLFFKSEIREFDPSLVGSGEVISLIITLKLVWLNNLLQLQVINSPNYLPIVLNTLNKSWFFDALQAERYQLRFVWSHPNKDESDSSQETMKLINAGQLATPFVNLCLIQSVGDDKSAVEVEGIRFETLLPKRVLSLPLSQTNVNTLVQIGISITNNKSNPIRFSLFATLIPLLIATNGQALKGEYARLRTRKPKESDFPLVMPGKSVSFFPDARLLWFDRDPFILNIASGDGGYWSFNALNLGEYQIQFTYKNKNAVVTIPVRERKNMQQIKCLWTGMVSTPFIKFSLVPT